RSKTTTAPGASQPPAASRSSAASPRPLAYGGSRKARSKAGPSAPGRTPRSVASRRCTRVRPKTPIASTFSRIAPRAAASVSTNRQKAAPRDKASNPSAPEPAKRSITRASRNPFDQAACSRMLKIAWRARSEVGRVASPGGAAKVLPRKLPETMRKRQLLLRGACRARTPDPSFGGNNQGGRAMGLVSIERRGGAAIVTYANPPIGTMTAAGAQEMLDELRPLTEDVGVRAIVITGGVPGIFIRHYDVGELSAASDAAKDAPPPPASPPAGGGRPAGGFLALVDLIAEAPKPVVAAIN